MHIFLVIHAGLCQIYNFSLACLSIKSLSKLIALAILVTPSQAPRLCSTQLIKFILLMIAISCLNFSIY